MKLDKQLERMLVDEDERSFRRWSVGIILVVFVISVIHGIIPRKYDEAFHVTIDAVGLISWIIFLFVGRKK